MQGSTDADQELVELLLTDSHGWNAWRERSDVDEPDLSGARLWDLGLAPAEGLNLRGANLRGSDLTGADLRAVDLVGADLRGANLRGARMRRADLRGTDLRGADLSQTGLIEANVDEAIMTGARVYGVAVWRLRGVPKDQTELVITDWDEPTITVDDLRVAQFIYLLLGNPEIREVIDTVARKSVLILGRFTPERKKVLDGLRNALGERNYVPILFDFAAPETRDLTETVATLAHLSRFIIADLTEPSSIPAELQAIVPDLAVPIVPVLASDEPYAVFASLQRKYHWVLKIHPYVELEDLLGSLDAKVIEPAEAKARELSGEHSTTGTRRGSPSDPSGSSPAPGPAHNEHGISWYSWE